MKNCNWRTKLRTNKTFIKGIKTKIRNQKHKEWNWKLINKEDNHIPFQVRERKEKGEKETTISYKASIIHRHAPHHEEEDMVALSKTQRKGKFGQQVDSYTLSKWTDVTHSLDCKDHASIAFSNKNLIIQCKNNKMPFMTLEITKKNYVKGQQYL